MSEQSRARQRFCLGFLFDMEAFEVLLIKKKKPAWQAGKYNGLGGKVEKNEAPLGGMVREFEEEAGVLTHQSEWLYFAKLQCVSCDVWCYASYWYPSKQQLCLNGSCNEGKLNWVPISKLWSKRVAPSIHYLIPLALQEQITEPVTFKEGSNARIK